MMRTVVITTILILYTPNDQLVHAKWAGFTVQDQWQTFCGQLLGRFATSEVWPYVVTPVMLRGVADVTCPACKERVAEELM